MGVLFSTDQGGTLYSDDLTADDVDAACVVFGSLKGYPTMGNDRFDSRVEYHVATRCVTMWWDGVMTPYERKTEAVHA